LTIDFRYAIVVSKHRDEGVKNMGFQNICGACKSILESPDRSDYSSIEELFYPDEKEDMEEVKAMIKSRMDELTPRARAEKSNLRAATCRFCEHLTNDTYHFLDFI